MSISSNIRQRPYLFFEAHSKGVLDHPDESQQRPGIGIARLIVMRVGCDMIISNRLGHVLTHS